jgi:hypothetical protein
MQYLMLSYQMYLHINFKVLYSVHIQHNLIKIIIKIYLVFFLLVYVIVMEYHFHILYVVYVLYNLVSHIVIFDLRTFLILFIEVTIKNKLY